MMRRVVYGLIILLAVLHQDFWWWNSDNVVFGFMPIGLAWHAGISVAAGVSWALAARYCWPAGVDVVDTADLPPRRLEGHG
jgi:hypothetical protein